MLSDIKKFFQQQPIATLAQVAKAIGAEPDVTRQMLEHFERKGVLKCLSEQVDGCDTGGGSCNGCPVNRCQQNNAVSLLFHWEG